MAPVITKISLAASKRDNNPGRHYCFVVEGENFTSDPNREPEIKIDRSNLFEEGRDMKKRRMDAAGKVWLVKARYKQMVEGQKGEDRRDFYGSEEISVTVTSPGGEVSNGGPSAILYEYGDAPPG